MAVVLNQVPAAVLVLLVGYRVREPNLEKTANLNAGLQRACRLAAPRSLAKSCHEGHELTKTSLLLGPARVEQSCYGCAIAGAGAPAHDRADYSQQLLLLSESASRL